MHFYTGYILWPSVWKSGSLTINTHHVSLTNNKLCTLTDHFIRNTCAPAHWCSHVAAPRVLNSCWQTWRAAVNVHIQDQKGENTRSPTETSSLVTELAQHLTSAVQIHNPGIFISLMSVNEGLNISQFVISQFEVAFISFLSPRYW